jgi:hypothetical protein
MSASRRGERPRGRRARGWLGELAATLGLGWVRRFARRIAQERIRPMARTKEERALAVVPQMIEGDEEPKWETPPRHPEAVKWRKVLTIMGVTATVYMGGVVVMYFEMRITQAAQNPSPSIPGAIGDHRINLLLQPMFAIETQAYDEHARESERLDSYGWTDRDAGIIHIPILRAMDDVLTGGDAGAPTRSRP